MLRRSRKTRDFMWSMIVEIVGARVLQNEQFSNDILVHARKHILRHKAIKSRIDLINDRINSEARYIDATREDLKQYKKEIEGLGGYSLVIYTATIADHPPPGETILGTVSGCYRNPEDAVRGLATIAWNKWGDTYNDMVIMFRVKRSVAERLPGAFLIE